MERAQPPTLEGRFAGISDFGITPSLDQKAYPLSEERLKEYGYPPVPEEFHSKEYWREIACHEQADPQTNPKLLLDEDSPAYLNRSLRQPHMKLFRKRAEHHKARQDTWIEQLEGVERTNSERAELADALQSCSMELKRLVAPILQYKFPEIMLLNMLEESKETAIPFSCIVDRKENCAQLWGIRRRIDLEGVAAADDMMREFESRVQSAMDINMLEGVREARSARRRPMDADTLAQALQLGAKHKEDGRLEWERGDWDDACVSWRKADAVLRGIKSRDLKETQLVLDLHIAVLKTLAQAAIKAQRWTEALEAANDAIAIDAKDHKAWFRRACALEGLGRLEESEIALDRIDVLTILHKDGPRIVKDLASKREKLRAVRERHRVICQKGLERALERGIFGEARGSARPEPPASTFEKDHDADEFVVTLDRTGGVRLGIALRHSDMTVTDIAEDGLVPEWNRANPNATIELGDRIFEANGERDLHEIDLHMRRRHALKLGLKRAPRYKIEERSRRRLTRKGAEELLDDLERAYGDTTLQLQVAKLAQDVCGDRGQFLFHVKRIALEAQAPVLERRGFEKTTKGVSEMQLALGDHMRGSRRAGGPVELRAKCERVLRILYGSMYDEVVMPLT